MNDVNGLQACGLDGRKQPVFHPAIIWQCVKTLVPSEPQNSWDLWMFIPLKMVFL